ncbi:MAG: hypothetical protein Q8Q62_15145 [Mesorhizobium sp.]|nr:hypothetical protein [Mesorhizobium sp.]
MNKFLIASVALLGFAGVAAAQQAPALYGSNYSDAVLNSQGQSTGPVRSGVVTGQSNISAPETARDFNINLSDNYSGK